MRPLWGLVLLLWFVFVAFLWDIHGFRDALGDLFRLKIQILFPYHW